MLKLYFAKGACSLAVRIVINELGVNAEYEAVDLRAKKTQAGKDFLQINPKGSVPTLALASGEILTENFVILQYLADSNKATQLCPAIGDFQRYRVLEWGSFIGSELHKPIGVLFNPALTAEMKEKLFLPLINTKLTYLNASIKENSFLMGDHFTIADAYLFVVLSWTFHFKIDLQPYPMVAAYLQKLKEYPAVIESLRQENL